jgi:hypothetical protein
LRPNINASVIADLEEGRVVTGVVGPGGKPMDPADAWAWFSPDGTWTPVDPRLDPRLTDIDFQ